jgi:acylglycerol lipase
MATEGRFQSRDGLDFFEIAWVPEAALRGHVVLVHGYAEHCKRYAHVARHLNALGFAVHSYDQRGHGQSPGKRGFIGSFDVLLGDLDTYLAHIQARLAGAPVFLMGHSMGGLVSTRFVQTRTVPFRGLVVSSPLLAIGDVSPVLIALAGLLGKLTPTLPVLALDAKAISRDTREVAAYESDPLVYHGKILARTGAELNAAIKAAQAAFAAITLPLLAFHGTADQLAPVAGSRLLHAGAASKDKSLREYDGGYHELLNEAEREVVLTALGDWLLARL